MNAECSGPRRPTMTTSRSLLLRSAVSAVSEMSVRARRSTSPVSTRATSRATFPLPMTTARSWSRSTRKSA
ncbi:Uncharacterised protein [Mycobacteroides abscessus subsp. abscessus]|nr:Uncharacterised protein [Mycobacteroides abscessus subsp. abscessus]SKW31200.1 Uncharacterised protein [Mycobacteroides abscessus subsp. abscessus]